MGMRIGGLATGMDIDSIVRDLMEAERIPLNKLEQDKTKLEWKRDAFRDINAMFLELDQMMNEMKRSRAYNTKMATSSNSAVTATAASSASNGSYNIAVERLATNAINVTNGTISDLTKEGIDGKIDPFAPLSEQMEGLTGDFPKTIAFKTYHNGEETHKINVTEEDSLNSVLTKITNQDNGVRAFYDVQSDRVIMERTSTGEFNPDGPEIDFGFEELPVDEEDPNDYPNYDADFFTKVFGMTTEPVEVDGEEIGGEQGGTNAVFKYNGVKLESKTNTTTLNGITFTFNDKTESTNVNITSDTEAAFDNIMDFVNKYNEIVEKVNGKVNEEVYRDYPPLTEEQMADMSEREIELWEEKAKSGSLKSEPILNNALSQMRLAWTGKVDNDGPFSHFSEIGISTTANYLDGGKLQVDEDKLRAALEEDSTAVYNLFSNNAEGAERGLMNRLEDAIDQTTDRINQQAGRTTQQPHQYALGRRLEGMDDRIADFQRRLQQTEDRYWRQFTAMETAIQRMNEQSNYLFAQFNQQ
ncbi:flagellar hook-associated protein 2 [Amphibacillus sp. Q70]|uniref:flagellar hook-associated protein 2 n=1 Tax=Amphibacillus sp. Q70 TaxID=3453416 RepID=UPI003F851D6E